MFGPRVIFATPRKLPKSNNVEGTVVVLDIAFAANMGGASFESVTKKFLDGIGDRLALWVDHHDHERHVDFVDDDRFVLCKKSEHGACPEMIDEKMVHRTGPVDSIVCHTDFDGLCAAAKWLRGGKECYPGADKDAHAIDTRLADPSKLGEMMDHALRARPRDESLMMTIVRFLVDGAKDKVLRKEIETYAQEYAPKAKEARRLAEAYKITGGIAVCDVTGEKEPFDRTELLLLGQRKATVAVVVDASSVAMAAPFDSGVNFLDLLNLEGGMPTRVSVARKRLDEVLRILKAQGFA